MRVHAKAILLLFVLSGASATAQVHDVNYQDSLAPLNTAPTFDHGYLVAYDWDNKVDLFAPDGSLLYKVSANVPGAARSGFNNAAVDSDGTMAAAVWGQSADGIIRGAIELFDRTGSQIGFLDTGNYQPTQVAFGTDHSIWALGWLWQKAASQATDYPTLRNYGQDGRALGQFLPRSSFPSDKDSVRGDPLLMVMLGGWELHVANDHVEIILHRPNLWIQTDLKGQETGRWTTDPRVPNGRRPDAVTPDGRAWYADPHFLRVFDRSAGVWQAVPFDLPKGNLVGADGNNLVFMLLDQDVLRWVPVPGVVRIR